MNSLCATGSGMSGLTSGVAISGIPAPTGFTVNNSISIPLDSDPDLVLHYPLNGDILNYTGSTPTTGTNDASIVGVNVSLSSSQSIFSGGKSLFKNVLNNTSYFSINNTFTTTNNGISTSFWVYLTNNSSGIIYSFANATNDNSRNFIDFSGGSFHVGGGGNTFINSYKFTNAYLNRWYHIVWTLDTLNNSKIYVNLNDVFTTSIIKYTNNYSFSLNYIFADTVTNGTSINRGISGGYINDFRLYNRVLNSYEINQLYNIYYLNPPKTVNKAFYLNTDISLVLYYPFDNNLLNYASGVGVSNGSISGENVFITSSDKVVGSSSLCRQSADLVSYFKFNNFRANKGGYTMSFWVKPGIGNGSIFIFYGTNARTRIIMYKSSTILIASPNAQNLSLMNTTYAPVLNTWAFYVWTIATNGTHTFYVDNVQKFTTTGKTSNTYYSIDFSYGYIFELGEANIGYVDDFRYYTRVITAQEMLDLYNYNYRFTYLNTLNLNSDPSLCLYYTFDLSTNSVSNYTQNVYGTIDATYNNGASANYTDLLSYIGTGGLKLLGTNSGYVQLLPTSVVNTTNFISNDGMTFACWFYSKTSGNNAKIFDFNDTYNSYNNNIFVSMNASNSISANVYTSPTTSSTVSLATNYNNSILYHFVWTMSYSNAQTSSWNIYINAINVSNTTSKYYPNQVARGSDFLGRSNISSDPSFNGYIDDFRVYQRVLTQTEITRIYAYNNTLNVNSANLSWTAANTTKTPLTYNYKYAPYYSSGLSWKAFYGNSNDNSSYLYYAAGAGNSSTNYNTFQNNSWYVGGANTLSSNSANVLTEIRYSYNTIANENNIFGFSINNKIALSISGYFKPDVTGIWTFQFGISTGNDDMSIFWIDDGVNVNGTTIHWPPTDNNSNFVSNYTITNIANSAYATTLTAGVYYPIQLNWGQNIGGSILALYFKSPGGSFIYNGSGYFFYQQISSSSSTPVNTSSTNSVINNLLDGNGITYSVNSQVGTKQSKYVSVTK